MKISKPNQLTQFLIKKITSALYKLENTGDSNHQKNGESNFINDLADTYRKTGAVVFDVGANIGEYTEIILNTFGPKTFVHLFEPQASCVELLKEKFKDTAGVKVNNFGLSNAARTAVLFKNTDLSGFASVHHRNLDHYHIQMDLTEEISLKTGIDYVTGHAIEKIHLLKVDVEGHELDVFGGFGDFLHPDRIDYIQFEYGGANLDSHTSLLELHNYLSAKGFILCKMKRNKLEIQSYDPRLENFMYQNWVAVSPNTL